MRAQDPQNSKTDVKNTSCTINEYAQIVNNTASGQGGGLYLYEGNTTFTMNGGNIQENSANEGGGVYSSYTTINFNDGTIGHNIAKSNGGGIYQTSGNLNVKGGVITGNEAKGNGGGVCVNPAKYNQTNVTVSGGDISNNTADENGGGIWMTKHSKNSKGTNLKISGGIIHDNNAKNGGGVYVNSGVVFSLYRTYITGNTAKEKAGGIYAGGASINVAETPIVRGNRILSGIGISGEKNLPNSNIYLPSGKKISITGDGLKPYIYYKGTEYEYSEDPILYVSTEKGAANITGNSADYSKYFFSDNPDYASKYADGVMKLVDAYKVTINWTDRPDTIVPVPKDNISKVALPDGEPYREGYLFVGWLLNGEDYNFNKPVTSDITLTPKWLKTGETAVSVNCNEYYVIGLQGKANVYLAAYKMGKLIDLCKLSIEAESYEINTKKIAETGLDITGADKMTVFLWNNTMTPLCESASVSFK